VACVAAFIVVIGNVGGTLRFGGDRPPGLSSDTVAWARPVAFIVTVYGRRWLRIATAGL
jgi:hypothetical protein